MLRFVLSPDGWVAPDIRRRAARPRGVDATELRDGEPGGLKTVVLARLPSQGGGGPFRSPNGRRAPRERRASVAVDGEQSRPCRRRRVQGRRGDKIGWRLGCDSGERRGSRRSGQRARVLNTKRSGGRAVARVDLFTSRQLDLALGRANVIHAALKQGAAGSAFLARADRLRRYRASEADPTTRTERGGAPADDAGTLGGPIKLAEKPSG